ncbi:hypothetical protein IV203_009561 [Nitzschia inconspicua]|uniref:Uncharacterized protein n=1 Tax=Nitzschia inconspicua TaxID=303405 RepID=A0A9K3PKL6_9STRA|nr:hypothetical protein IV203_009561 [Nitzschia inconspicua]
MVRAKAGVPGDNVGTYLISHACNSGFVVFQVNDPLGPSTTFTRSDVFVPVFYECDLQGAPQLGSTELIETNDSRVQTAIWVDNVLWITVVVREFASGEAALLYFQFVANGLDPVFVLFFGVISGEDISAETSVFCPSLDVNSNGIAAFGFTASSPTIFAGAYATVQNLDFMIEPSEAVKVGEGPYFVTGADRRNFWGFKSGMSVDPTDDNCFWAFNQYARDDTCFEVGSSILASDENVSSPHLEPFQPDMQSLEHERAVDGTEHFAEGDVRRLQTLVGCWGTAWAHICAPP